MNNHRNGQKLSVDTSSDFCMSPHKPNQPLGYGPICIDIFADHYMCLLDKMDRAYELEKKKMAVPWNVKSEIKDVESGLKL